MKHIKAISKGKLSFYSLWESLPEEGLACISLCHGNILLNRWSGWSSNNKVAHYDDNCYFCQIVRNGSLVGLNLPWWQIVQSVHLLCKSKRLSFWSQAVEWHNGIQKSFALVVILTLANMSTLLGKSTPAEMDMLRDQCGVGNFYFETENDGQQQQATSLLLVAARKWKARLLVSFTVCRCCARMNEVTSWESWLILGNLFLYTGKTSYAMRYL